MTWLYVFFGALAGAAVGFLIKQIDKTGGAGSCECGVSGSCDPTAANTGTSGKKSACLFCNPVFLGLALGCVAGGLVGGLADGGATENRRQAAEAVETENPHLKTQPVSLLRPVSSTDFPQQIASGIAIVDFHADWCGPCQLQKPILEAFAAEAGNEVRVLTVNVDEQPELARQFRIRGIPTIAFFRNGKLVGNRTGVVEKELLRKAIQQIKELPAQ